MYSGSNFLGASLPWPVLLAATAEVGSRRLDEYVATWNMETVAQCLHYCRDWNTNARKSVVVHGVVGSILRCMSITSLMELPVSWLRVMGVSRHVVGLVWIDSGVAFPQS